MQPAHYLTSPYYEHGLHAAEHYGVRRGRWTPRSSKSAPGNTSRTPTPRCPTPNNPDLVAFTEAVVPGGAPAVRDSEAREVRGRPPGHRVADAPKGHTRTGSLRPRQEWGHRAGPRRDRLPRRGRERPGARSPSTSTPSVRPTRSCGAPSRPSRTPRSTFDAWEPYLVPAATQEAPVTILRTPSPQPTTPGPRRRSPPGEGRRVHHDREGADDRPRRSTGSPRLRERGRPAARREGRREGVDRPRVQGAAAR